MVFSGLSDSMILFCDSVFPHLLQALFCGILAFHLSALCQSLRTMAEVQE